MKVEVQGAELDAAEEGTGHSLVWMHGLTDSRDAQDDGGLIGPPRRAGWRTISYDARGHGRSSASDAPADYDWANLAGDLLAVADRFGARQFVAAGASMGAATALHAATLRPERITGLILAIPPTAWEGRRLQAANYETAAGVVEREGLAGYVRGAMDLPLHPVAVALGSSWLAERRSRLEGLDPAVLPTLLRGAAGSDLPPLSALAAVEQPTLILAWPGDVTHPVSTAETLAATMPNVELHLAETLSDVQGWRALMASWLAGIAPPPPAPRSHGTGGGPGRRHRGPWSHRP